MYPRNTMFRRCFVVSVDTLVYARHGRELMGLKSPVSVPVLGFNLA
jgi:hypothetical protein